MGMDRRSLMKTGIIAGGAVWVAPMISSVTAAAAASTGCTNTIANSFQITAGVPETSPANQQLIFATISKKIPCIGPLQHVYISDTPNAVSGFYLDELIRFTINGVVSNNFGFWASSSGCPNLGGAPGLTQVNTNGYFNNANPTSGSGPWDITSLFPVGTGSITVKVDLQNCAGPQGTRNNPLYLVIK